MIRWIRPNLGTAPALEVMAVPDLQLVDVRILVDGPGNSPSLVRAKIDEAVAHLQAGRRVVVGCEYGISRSNAPSRVRYIRELSTETFRWSFLSNFA